jgi:hypothetical protein
MLKIENSIYTVLKTKLAMRFVSFLETIASQIKTVEKTTLYTVLQTKLAYVSFRLFVVETNGRWQVLE